MNEKDVQRIEFDRGDQVNYGTLECEITAIECRMPEHNTFRAYYDLICEDGRKFKGVPQEALNDFGDNVILLMDEHRGQKKRIEELKEERDEFKEGFHELQQRIDCALYWREKKEDYWKAEKILKGDIDVQWPPEHPHYND